MASFGLVIWRNCRRRGSSERPSFRESISPEETVTRKQHYQEEAAEGRRPCGAAWHLHVSPAPAHQGAGAHSSPRPPGRLQLHLLILSESPALHTHSSSCPPQVTLSTHWKPPESGLHHHPKSCLPPPSGLARAHRSPECAPSVSSQGSAPFRPGHLLLLASSSVTMS